MKSRGRTRDAAEISSHGFINHTFCLSLPIAAPLKTFPDRRLARVYSSLPETVPGIRECSRSTADSQLRSLFLVLFYVYSGYRPVKSWKRSLRNRRGIVSALSAECAGCVTNEFRSGKDGQRVCTYLGMSAFRTKAASCSSTHKCLPFCNRAPSGEYIVRCKRCGFFFVDSISELYPSGLSVPVRQTGTRINA